MSNRKRQRIHQEVKVGLSGVAKGINQRIKQRNYPEALSLLDKTISQNQSAGWQAKLLALAGDGEFQQGKFSNALEVYQKSEVLALEENDPQSWFRAIVGQVRSLLKQVQVPEAYQVAEASWQKALDWYEKHQQEIKEAQQQLLQNGKLTITKRPHRPSVVGARLGKLFFAGRRNSKC
ncbi:MAG: hypothetical protein K1X66_01665 [Verrucomicrobiae bacterium]|nr:hypothetical protein [Verrucomicrobiae bacterium]